MAEALLDKLRDIHLPEGISGWPRTFAWAILVIIFFILLIRIGLMMYRYWQRGSAKREALSLLLSYQKDYEQDENSAKAAALISQLLRRVALVYFGREKVAGLKNDDWIDFLTKTSRTLSFNDVREQLLVLPYQGQGEPTDLNLLFAYAKTWINQRGRHV